MRYALALVLVACGAPAGVPVVRPVVDAGAVPDAYAPYHDPTPRGCPALDPGDCVASGDYAIPDVQVCCTGYSVRGQCCAPSGVGCATDSDCCADMRCNACQCG